jgi:hypothetical protein
MLRRVLDDVEATTRIRTMREARMLGRRPRLLAETSGRGYWRGAGDDEFWSSNAGLISLRD